MIKIEQLECYAELMISGLDHFKEYERKYTFRRRMSFLKSLPQDQHIIGKEVVEIDELVGTTSTSPKSKSTNLS